jgi:DNA-nicking Smr family endonuclease
VKQYFDKGASDSRLLTNEEIELWRAVARSVAPRKGAALPLSRRRAAPAAPPKTESPAAQPKAKPKAPPQSLALAPLEKRLKRQLARGGAGPDDAIDLHGMTEAQAHRALRGFLSYSHARGSRLVLIITGKGESKGPRPSLWAEEPGVLRRLTPHWLRAPDLRAIVLGFEEAGRSHGGAGALYVRLRRVREAAR